jgi:hypothetical protein
MIVSLQAPTAPIFLVCPERGARGDNRLG